MNSNKAHTLSGQWIGSSKGDPDSLIVMDLDNVDGRAKGFIYLYPEDPELPASLAQIDTENELKNFTLRGHVTHFLSSNGHVPTWPELSDFFPNVSLPRDVEGKFTPKNTNEIEVDWKTEVGTHGAISLRRSTVASKSIIPSDHTVQNWEDFQKYVLSNPTDGLVFRGQSETWPLQTTFHRTKRCDLKRYLEEDIPRLHRALSARTKHLFNLQNPIEMGAFLNLAQHHGFPTPLLDWSQSPFVAAYFAFQGVKKNPSGSVRIFAFDKSRYQSYEPQFQHLAFVRPHFSNLEALALENERAIPQQGFLTLTNLFDIENYLHKRASGGGKYLRAFDLPASEAPKVIQDLRLMGITKATLFPGIESICEELSSLHF